jgi:hypothetical protein
MHGLPGKKALHQEQREAVGMKERRKTNKGGIKRKSVMIIFLSTMRSYFAKWGLTLSTLTC